MRVLYLGDEGLLQRFSLIQLYSQELTIDVVQWRGTAALEGFAPSVQQYDVIVLDFNVPVWVVSWFFALGCSRFALPRVGTAPAERTILGGYTPFLMERDPQY